MSILEHIRQRAAANLQHIVLPEGEDPRTVAAASAAGVDLGRDLIEKNVVNRLVPKIIQRIAAKASAEFVEKWTGRLIPVVSSLIGATLNYYFVRGWGERAHAHFREKHLQVRQQMQQQRLESLRLGV